MITPSKAMLLSAVMIVAGVLLVGQDYSAPKTTSEYNGSGQMKLPTHYREWVYLTSGFDMSYNPAAQMPDHHMFDNVFVNPEAYKVFAETGTWPDKTMLVLEVRGAMGKGSINQRGNYQGDTMGIEV